MCATGNSWSRLLNLTVITKGAAFVQGQNAQQYGFSAYNQPDMTPIQIATNKCLYRNASGATYDQIPSSHQREITVAMPILSKSCGIKYKTSYSKEHHSCPQKLY